MVPMEYIKIENSNKHQREAELQCHVPCKGLAESSEVKHKCRVRALTLMIQGTKT